MIEKRSLVIFVTGEVRILVECAAARVMPLKWISTY